MYCEECQERPATLHFTKIVNGEKTEFHICEHCAKEKGEWMPGSNTFSIHHLLSGMLHGNVPAQNSSGGERISPSKACGKCGMTYQQFAKIGRFGCAKCYETFGSKLDPMLKRVHGGSTFHAGKIPKRAGVNLQEKKMLQELKQEMQRHIQSEEFEKAAETRDTIRKLEQKLNTGRDSGDI
ncbi:UvrB/UvrC motif-containing protein [Fictibacillus aquaticus]|uniref:UVR domain-containing protein n=1 Tax=Fictibacillus aquaticus TaxID=2021314 RepID=A0A235F7A7_9BACL|nr:UvrB/UvrC motif-containing protein [Fictibacillus aquaticus]OYD57102.1 hypothetical protein CGZ90_14360 [Fictibacillus aquaticus]